MAQIKPRSSRPTAVMIFLLSLPAAANLMYRLCSRCCAFRVAQVNGLLRHIHPPSRLDLNETCISVAPKKQSCLNVRVSGKGRREPFAGSIITDYLVTVDCRSAPLISLTGSLDSLCWPYFDGRRFFGNWQLRKPLGYASGVALHAEEKSRGSGRALSYFPQEDLSMQLWRSREASAMT